MTIKTRNKVTIRGFVGRYVRLPLKRGDPARFDVGTIERFRTDSGELITFKNWHTVRTYNIEQVEESIRTGDVVEVSGRMDTAIVGGNKVVEVVSDDVEVILTQEQRNVLRNAIEDFDESV
jgi:hypothetical protein